MDKVLGVLEALQRGESGSAGVGVWEWECTAIICRSACIAPAVLTIQAPLEEIVQRCPVLDLYQSLDQLSNDHGDMVPKHNQNMLFAAGWPALPTNLKDIQH